MNRKIDSKEIRKVLEKFYKVTEEEREGKPVHVPITKWNGLNFLEILSKLYGISKEDSLKLVDKAVSESIIGRARVKKGYALFLEARKGKKKSEIDLTIFK
jgi:hypothetical protein